MASQVVELDRVAEFDSYIRGYHAYIDIWSPVVGEILLLKREPDNLVDASAVAVWKESIRRHDENLSLTFFISTAMGTTGSCSMSEYISGDSELPVCAGLDDDHWEDNFMESLTQQEVAAYQASTMRQMTLTHFPPRNEAIV